MCTACTHILFVQRLNSAVYAYIKPQPSPRTNRWRIFRLAGQTNFNERARDEGDVCARVCTCLVFRSISSPRPSKSA